MDFYKILENRQSRKGKSDSITIEPDFQVVPSHDIMTRGNAFYAFWDEQAGLWSTDEFKLVSAIDKELCEVYENARERYPDCDIVLKKVVSMKSNVYPEFKKFCKLMPETYEQLDTKVVFADEDVCKDDYVAHKLNYSLAVGDCPAWNELISTLYDPIERAKIEWIIGAIITGDSKWIQKFAVFYGSHGTGKSTIMKIIEKLFKGYTKTFDGKALGSSSNQFSTEALKDNPLVCVQHDGNLSRIEDNTLINSIVSHEPIIINEKFKSAYSMSLNTFLIMGTNSPVRITDSKSGLIRRLIDINPSGRTVSHARYKTLLKRIDFELGFIAQHCLELYLKMGPDYYDNYVPIAMMYKTDPFFNFVEEHSMIFDHMDRENGGVSLKEAYMMYKKYCNESGAEHIMQQYKFREELKDYFEEFYPRKILNDGTKRSAVFHNLKKEKFEAITDKTKLVSESDAPWLDLKVQESVFDRVAADWPAQYADEDGTPLGVWDKVTTKLSDLDTSRLHYVMFPDIHHIVADFDKKDENGNKSLELNLEAAKHFPPTYAEVSKSGQGLHLHYFYKGDPEDLRRIFDEDVEIKVYTGKSSLRRQLSLCNDLDISEISSGLPKREKKKVIDFETVKNEKMLRAMLKKNLNKEYHQDTSSSVNYICKLLDEAYESGITYDVSDMEEAIFNFASNSTNQAGRCLKALKNVHFKSEEDKAHLGWDDESPFVVYDIECFPNLFLVNWKVLGKDKKMVRWINPTPEQMDLLMTYRLIGFNNRKYDNHMIWARSLGYSNEQLFRLSQALVSNEKGKTDFKGFLEAYNISYADIYDFAAKKQSLKKWEIELGIHHHELGFKWDEPVPEELWAEVSAYCDDDVYATEAVWEHLQPDFMAREILADMSGLTPNHTTRNHTTKIIFGNDKNTEDELQWYDMSDTSDAKPVPGYDEYTMFDSKGRAIFPGYKFERGKSTYRGHDIGEGGRVYAEPGMYSRVALLDIASMHPSTIEAIRAFGKYTDIYSEIKTARVYIKHKEYDKAMALPHIGEALKKYLDPSTITKQISKALAQALKIVINSVYGYTSATFANPFKSTQNVDNIVAKRGALFMENLLWEVQKRGYTVVHIKTDSIKIADADPSIVKFVQDYGKLYGYNFEHEAVYEKMCLVNDAVYIAKFATPEYCKATYGYSTEENDDAYVQQNGVSTSGFYVTKEDGSKKWITPWTATGTQFQVPFVFKTLFSGEKIKFADLCETKSVTGSMYLDLNEDNPDEHELRFVGKVGLFCPIKAGRGGGLLVRTGKSGDTDKLDAVTGTKGYRWLESETVINPEMVDKNYYYALVDKAVESISKYGDFEWFAGDKYERHERQVA